MKNFVKSVIVGAAVVMTGNAAMADDGFYVGAFGVASFYQDLEGKIDGSTASSDNSIVDTNRTVELDTGFGGVLEAGYNVDDFTISLSGGWRQAETDSITSATNVDGDADIYTAFVNVGYNFDTGTEITPFVNVGGGLIVADADVSFTDTADDNAAVSESETIYAPGVRAGVGFDYAIDANTSLSAAYDLMLSFDGDFDNKFGKADDDLLVHSVMIGIKYGF